MNRNYYAYENIISNAYENFNYLFYGLCNTAVILKELGKHLSFSVKSEVLTRGWTPSYT